MTGEGGCRWILDPIDGTRNYARGVPVWATLMALEEDGTVRLGVTSAPALGRRWWAERGEGAFADAAVQVIAEEAGGRFSDLAGESRIDGRSAVTSNGLLHDEILGAVAGRAARAASPGIRQTA